MSGLEFNTNIKVGKTRKKVEDINLSFGGVLYREKEKNWRCLVNFSGRICNEKELEGNSAFNCIMLGIAYLRQALRALKSEDPKIKFFEEIEGDLEEITIEDIFWTHDCITDEIEEMIEWAQENGFEAE